MTEYTKKIDLNIIYDPDYPYRHLLPLVDDLITHNRNRLALINSKGRTFIPSRDSFDAYLYEPLDMEFIRKKYDLTTSRYDAANDILDFSRDYTYIRIHGNYKSKIKFAWILAMMRRNKEYGIIKL